MSARSAIFSAISIAALFGASQARAVLYPTIISTAEMNRPALEEAVTGAICIYSGRDIVNMGSGAVIASPRVVLSCAHVNMRNGQWLAPGNIRFTARAHSQNAPATGVFLRSYYKYDSYSTAVKQWGNNSNGAYHWDIIAGYAYTNFAGGYSGGYWSSGAETVLKTNNYIKKTTGYPWEQTRNFYQYRINNFYGAFTQQYGAYYTLTNVTSYGGNSGGPVWGWHPTARRWYVAGVFVSSNRRDNMGVRALDANGINLLNLAKKAAG